MKIELFKTLWGHDDSLEEALALAAEAGFSGIEGPVPAGEAERETFVRALEASGMHLIAEASTCTPAGTYVPTPGHSPAEHLSSLAAQVVTSLPARPRFINTMAGWDAWREEEALEFFRGLLDLEQQHGIAISAETHRGRPTYSPWLTKCLLAKLPDLKLTCDFSHWCVVSERLVLDEEPELLALAARHAFHLQTRVGYAQGPQVPDPRAPEHADALDAHERWWDVVWESMADRGFTSATMTPEFGPDGYLQCAPFTRQPVADLWEVNRWIAARQRTRFEEKFTTTH